MLKKLQEEQLAWSIKNNLQSTGEFMLLGVTEELGELCHAHLKAHQGIRVNENHKEAKVDAIGDIVTYLAAYCNCEGINFEVAVQETWDRVKQRDWNKNKNTGE